MADAAKSDEIEDVLSSIRRLVSEHQPPQRAEPPRAVIPEPAPVDQPELASQPEVDEAAASVEAEAPVTSDTLILTPALRVTDPEDPWVPITPRTEEDQGHGQDAAAPTRADGEDWARDLWAEEFGEDTAQDEADPQLQADQWEEAGETEALATAEAEAEDAALAAPEPEALDAPQDITEAVLDAQDEVSEADDDISPEDFQLSFIRSTRSVRDYEPEEGDGSFIDEELPEPTLQLAEARGAHPVSDRTRGAADAPAQVRVEVVKALVESDAESASLEDAAGVAEAQEAAEDEEVGITPEAAEDAPEAVALPEAEPDSDPGPAPEIAPEDPAMIREVVAEEVADFLAQEEDPAPVEDLGEGPFTFPDEGEGFVDEEMLRQIIGEVVREELQGELGVRITRNVRKLVRREIRLALTAEEFKELE